MLRRCCSVVVILCALTCLPSWGQEVPSDVTLSDEYYAEAVANSSDGPPPDVLVPEVPIAEDVTARLDQLEAELRDLRSHPAAAQAPVTLPGGLKYPTVTVNGVFQADAMFFQQDATSLATVGDIQDGAAFRRLRLATKGAVAENVNYFVQMDFGFFGRPTFTDVWFELTQVPWLGNVRVGQWKQPFGLEVVTSFRYQTFMERSLLFQSMDAFRHIGIGFYDHSEDENWTWALSGFRTGNDQFGGDIGDAGGWSTAGRMTHLLWYDKQDTHLSYLHTGGAFWFGDPGNNLFRYATIPEMYMGSFGVPAGTLPGTSKVQVPTVANGTPPFLDTGNFGTQHFTHLGAELLWVNGPLSLQGEAAWAIVNPTAGDQHIFPGAYGEVSYFLTGESRPYDRKAGALDRVLPHDPFLTRGGEICGPGAWELAFRASHLDLNDGTIQAGRLTDLTAGVNWYLNGYTKIQMNYVKAFLDNPAFGKSQTDIFGMRAQIDF